MRKTVFIDASSAILLFKAMLFDLLTREFQVVVGASVFREITEKGHSGSDYFLTHSGFTVRRPDPDKATVSGMGPGETDTLTLFYNADARKEPFIIIDDGRAARFCRRQNLPFINALLVPKIFRFAGLMDEKTCREKTVLIRDLGWYSDRVISIAANISKTDLTRFLPEASHD